MKQSGFFLRKILKSFEFNIYLIFLLNMTINLSDISDEAKLYVLI